MLKTLFSGQGAEALAWIAVMTAALVAVFLLLRILRPQTRGSDETWILVDGSNVMHWQDNMARLQPVRETVAFLKSLGYVPGVVFDANAGWKLEGRYLHDGDFARRLDLGTRQVMVVPKGTQADPFLLTTAREFCCACRHT